MSEKENPFGEDETSLADDAEASLDNMDEPDMDDSVEDEPDDIEIAFDEAMSEGKSEDEVMLAMIEAGATFKNVKSRFNALMVDNGYLDSRAEKAEIVASTLEGRDLSTEEGLDQAISDLSEKLKGVNAKSAAASIRQYAKKHELEIYKKPKGAGVGRSGITSKFHDWVVANIPVTENQVAEWIEANGTDNTKRHSRVYLGQALLANRAYNKAAGVEEAA